MRILELTTYSAGGCGVFARVKEEAIRLAERGHEVVIFSSNFTKGSTDIAIYKEKLGKVLIRRFPAKKLGGESYMKWEFEEEALRFNPDIIIAHSYRHKHTTKIINLKEKLHCKIFLVTHAPFGSSTRTLPAR